MLDGDFDDVRGHGWVIARGSALRNGDKPLKRIRELGKWVGVHAIMMDRMGSGQADVPRRPVPRAPRAGPGIAASWPRGRTPQGGAALEARPRAALASAG